MALTDAQWSAVVADVVAQLIAGEITESQAAAEIASATEDWPTRTLSNADLAARVSRFLARLNGLILTDGPPDLSLGDLNAFAYDTANGALYGPKTPQGWGTPISLVGPQGDPVELQKSATHVQWRHVGDADWIDLIALADLAGADGQEVSLQANATHIQWRLGAGAWQDLVALADLMGADGREVQLQKSATHIQWRYSGDAAWTDLVPLEDIRGIGDPGWSPVFATVADGERRVLRVADWIGGQGAKPATGAYIGPLGFVATAAEATNIRGAGGAGTGDMLAENNLSDLTDFAAARTNLDVYSRTQVDGAIADKADADDVYSKSAADLLLADKADAADTYTKAEVDQALGDKQDALGFTPEDAADKGQPNGYAGLGADGKVPAGQLPDPPAVPMKATGAETRTGTNDAKFITPKALSDADAYVAVAASGAFTLDFAAGRNFNVVLSANSTMNVPTSMKDGQSGTIRFVQDATGSRTLGLATAIKKFGTYTLSTAANAVDRCGYIVCNGVLELTALEKGLG